MKSGGERRDVDSPKSSIIYHAGLSPFQTFIVRAKAKGWYLWFSETHTTVRAHSPILEDGEDGEGGSVIDDTFERQVVVDSAAVEKRRKQFQR